MNGLLLSTGIQTHRHFIKYVDQAFKSEQNEKIRGHLFFSLNRKSTIHGLFGGTVFVNVGMEVHVFPLGAVECFLRNLCLPSDQICSKTALCNDTHCTESRLCNVHLSAIKGE
jgi:hypothetical protein